MLYFHLASSKDIQIDRLTDNLEGNLASSS